MLSFSEALHCELAPKGVRVTTLCPGPVMTEFQARAGVATRHVPFFGVPAARVAEAGYRGLMRGKRLVVPGLGNRMVTFLPRILPRALMLALADARQRVRRASSAPAT